MNPVEDIACRRITAIDLFCGAGGFSLAARNLGIHVLAALENDPSACDSYRTYFSRFPSPPEMFEGDIRNISPEEMLAVLPEGAAPDILMGGPPCQGFSSLRLRDSGVNDPRNTLLIRYFDFVRALRPTAFLVENVVGLLWPRHKNHLEKFYAEAASAGYDVCPPVVLNACDYGVPQRRKRVFILGWKNKMPCNPTWPPAPTHCNPGSPVPGLEPWRPAAEAFLHPAPQGDANDVHMKHGEALLEVFRSTPLNGGSRKDSCRVLPCHENHDGHKDVYGRIDPSKPAPTMTTACINPSKGRFLHPTEHHGITVRQAARLQTFPDDFIFTGGLMSAARQVGNAVPIRLGEAVLRSILSMMTKTADSRR